MQFGKLGEMIAAHTRLKEHSKFLFIPGPDDAGIDIVDNYSRSLFFFFLCHTSLSAISSRSFKCSS